MNNFHKLLKSGLAIVGAALLTACSSNDEPVNQTGTDPSNAIRFAAATLTTRTGDYTTQNLKSFNVYAYTGTATSPTPFMENVTVTKSATNLWTYSPIQYWPADKEVDFYAFAPADFIGNSTPLKEVTYMSYPGNQDIIYAVSPNLMGNTGVPNAQVIFNFRHALSKVTLKMSSSNTELKVQVSNVVIANLNTTGNFHFPASSTAAESGTAGTGYWTDQNTPASYILHMSQTPTDVITLTTTPTVVNSFLPTNNGTYVVPQPLLWDNNGSSEKDMYIAVMCSVYDASTGVKLWPNDNTPEENVVAGSTYGDGILKFPLKTSYFSEFRPGYNYTYNLVVNSNAEMGAIEFGDPTVSSYMDVSVTYE